MKKRQKPTLLIAILVACGAVALGINGLQSGVLKLPEPAPPTAGTGAPRESTTSAEKVAENSKQALNELKTATDPNTKAIADFKKSLGGRPLMAITKQSAAAGPQPNDSSISTQWYRDKTYTAKKAGE